MDTCTFSVRRRADRFDDEILMTPRGVCSVVTAVVGSAVVGAAASKSAAKKSAAAQNNATAAAERVSDEQIELDRERFGLDRERFAFEKQQWGEGAADRQYASEVARQVGDRQIKSMDQQYDIADDYWDYQKGTFRPLELGLVKSASEYDTAARRDQAAAAADADVNRAFSDSQKQNLRLAGRFGIGGGRFASMANANSLARASASAGAQNKARNDIETKGYAMKMDAASLGRNLASNQNAAVSSALAQGNAGVQNSLVPTSIARQATADMSGAYGNMSNAYGNMSNALQNNFSNTLDLGRIRSQNFYDSQNFGMNVGSNVANSLMTGYGLASGRYTPPGWS